VQTNFDPHLLTRALEHGGSAAEQRVALQQEDPSPFLGC
jgi:hypothetical protein